MTYEDIKAEVLASAKDKAACADQYRRASKASTLAELAKVIADNFHWCCDSGLLTADTITRWGLRDHGIYANEDVPSGCYGLATDSATVEAYGSATVEAYDSATVEAYDSATVRAYGSATVEAYDSATVRAYDSAYVNNLSSIECKISDQAIVRSNGRVLTAFGSIDMNTSNNACTP